MGVTGSGGNAGKELRDTDVVIGGVKFNEGLEVNDGVGVKSNGVISVLIDSDDIEQDKDGVNN